MRIHTREVVPLLETLHSSASASISAWSGDVTARLVPLLDRGAGIGFSMYDLQVRSFAFIHMGGAMPEGFAAETAAAYGRFDDETLARMYRAQSDGVDPP